MCTNRSSYSIHDFETQSIVRFKYLLLVVPYHKISINVRGRQTVRIWRGGRKAHDARDRRLGHCTWSVRCTAPCPSGTTSDGLTKHHPMFLFFSAHVSYGTLSTTRSLRANRQGVRRDGMARCAFASSVRSSMSECLTVPLLYFPGTPRRVWWRTRIIRSGTDIDQIDDAGGSKIIL